MKAYIENYPPLKFIGDYAEALSKGAVPSAYVRLMFLGAGGAGKSSLLDGLMNNALQKGESTALADTRTVSFQWIKAADSCEEAWKEHTSSDEARSLACHSCRIAENNRRGGEEAGSFVSEASSATAVITFGVAAGALHYLEESISKDYREQVSKTKNVAYRRIIQEAKQQSFQLQKNKNPDVVMHIWDCGGQPVFLDIISAFLTPRTMFMLLFDASISLEQMYEEKWHHDGKVIAGREQNITHLQLMMQWLQLIHSSLVAKDEGLSPTDATQSLTISFEIPKVMLVGSRRDKIKAKAAKSVKEQLQSACGGAAFGDLVVDNLLVDNTKAGKGKRREDPGYKKIRENISKFAESLIVPTPLAWVAFRQVLQATAQDKPLLSYSEVVVIAVECDIPKEVVPSVLHFYHQLGALLHYATIPSLANTVIVEPQWFIEQLRLLLMPEWFGHRSQHMQRFWKWFEGRGVLTEELYQEIWKNCGLKGGPQALVDVLDHFDLAKKISEWPADMDFSKGKKYFVPCILKIEPKANCSRHSQVVCKREAAMLHIVFNTGYTPPGFFVRLVAQMTDEKGFVPLIDREVYRNKILFKCRNVDRIIVSESLKSISVRFFRVAVRKLRQYRFAESSIWLCDRLIKMAVNVLQWMPSVKFQLAFTCRCSNPEHFVFLEPNTHRETTLFCSQDKEFQLSPQHQFWLPSAPVNDVSSHSAVTVVIEIIIVVFHF